jgi:hypothetical protein
VELINDIKLNSQRVLKKYSNPELDLVLRNVQSAISLSDNINVAGSVTTGRKLPNGINSKSRVAIYLALSNSSSLIDSVARLSLFASHESFDFDLWAVCCACVSQEPIYNRFYAMLCTEMCARRRNTRKSCKLFFKRLRSEIDSYSFKQVYLLGRFFGEVIVKPEILPFEFYSLFVTDATAKTDVFIISSFTTNIWTSHSRPCILNGTTSGEICSSRVNFIMTHCRKIERKLLSGKFSSLPNISRFSENLGVLFSSLS